MLNFAAIIPELNPFGGVQMRVPYWILAIVASVTSRRVLVSVAILVIASIVTFGQTDTWHPSRWGANDQRGAANRITPAKILEAKNLITRGTVYQLGRVYEAGMPMAASRH